MASRFGVTCVSVAALSLASWGAYADHKHGHGDNHDDAEHHHDDHAHHDDGEANLGEQEAHVHGAWEMFAALDDATLSVTLKGPLVDALGFETLPASDEEWNAVAALKEKLLSHKSVLALDERARCDLETPAAIALPAGFSKAVAEDDHDDHDHEDHGHDDHDDADHDHDDHDHEGHDHDDHAHHDIHTNNLEVTYVFDCASPTRLGGITVAGFETFPAMENVEAVFLGDVSQIVNQLDKKSPTLEIGK